MKLLRLGFVHFNPSFKEPEVPGGFEMDDVIVEVDAQWVDEENKLVHYLLVTAKLHLGKLPKREADGRVLVPKKQVRAAEKSIELFADLVATANPRKRFITSPRGVWVGLIAENDEERNWLARCSGFVYENRPVIAVSRRHEFKLDESVVNSLIDRIDGVQLLAEACSHDHATGRFHELARFFERAFAKTVWLSH
jgi:hypothetical protein